MYEATREPDIVGISSHSIGQELGFDSKTTNQIVDYLRNEGLIEYPMLGPVVKITHRGIVEVEKILSDPPMSTERFPSKVISSYNLFRFFDAVENPKKNESEVVASNSQQENVEWDVFVSHAGEDKDSFVRPFVEKLRSMGLKVWYDEFELKWGSKLMMSIHLGLKKSRYGIVVLSRAFFGKPWPEAELAALFNMMITSKKDTLLPLRHGISHKELIEKTPLLSDIINRSSDDGVDALAQEFYGMVKGIDARKSVHSEDRKLTDGPLVQIVNFGIEPPASAEENTTRYHPNLRNDGNVPVSNIRIHYKVMDRVVSKNDIIRMEDEIKSQIIIYEGSISPTHSARVDSVELCRTTEEASAIFWLVYDFDDNKSTEIVYDVRFKNFKHTRHITYLHSDIARARKGR